MTDFFSDVNEEQEKGIDRLRDISERSTQDDASLDEVRRNVISGQELEWSDGTLSSRPAKTWSPCRTR
jgi:hypothetical protein